MFLNVIFNKYFSFSVFIVFVMFNLSFSQLVDQAVETTELSTTESSDVTEFPNVTVTEMPSEVICSVCACADGIVNCSNVNISVPFELTDWDGLASFNPITVDLSQNLLSSFTRISRLPIQTLNISNCGIVNIEIATFMYLEDLKILDLSRNEISTSHFNKMVLYGPLNIYSGPSPFKQIQDVNLAFNELHSLPQDLFMYMVTLTSLDLSGNPLAYIDQVTMGAISDLVNLKRLSLSSCELETLPEGLLRRQRKLLWLDVSDNRFTTIPFVLQEAPKLTFLNLDKNPIQVINKTNVMFKLISLKELHLCRMSRLENITAEALGGLRNLEILWLNYNPRLTNLDPRFLHWQDEFGGHLTPTLKEWYLNNNNLTSIDSHFLDSWNDLVIADFSNNPYVCDCHSQWMVDVLTHILTDSLENNTLNQMVCKKPPHLRGLTFTTLSNVSKTLVCTESVAFTQQTTPDLAIILGIMIGIIVTFPIVLILVLLWKRGYFAKFCRGRKVRKDGYYDDENENL